MYISSTCITHKYIVELLSVFSEHYYCTFGIFRLPSAILIYIHISKYVKKLSNEKFLDVSELDDNFITYYKEPKYIEWKIRHFLASLFVYSLPFPYDIPLLAIDNTCTKACMTKVTSQLEYTEVLHY